MEITIEWTNQAENQLKDVFDFYMQEAGLKMAKRIIAKIIKRVEILYKNPFSGPMEDLLSGYPQDFRYLVESNYKIIYWLNGNKINIVMVFDCRQNPVKLKQEKEI